MARVERVLLVTGELIATGVVVGAACAILAIAYSAIAAGQARDLLRPGFWLFCGAVGAAIGAVVAPLMSWLLLRHVPLGRAILHTVIGTVLGGMLGLTLGNPFAGSIVGFGVAAVRLSITAKHADASVPMTTGRRGSTDDIDSG